MSLVAEAARQLAQYGFDPGSRAGPVHSPFAVVEEVMEVGLVVMYARSFTGNARLGESWRPTDAAGRALHQALIDARNGMYAHADWTNSRTLVDTNAMLGIAGPPVLAEQRSRTSKGRLVEIADLAERQSARFLEAAGRLKLRLGVGNAAWWNATEEASSPPHVDGSAYP